MRKFLDNTSFGSLLLGLLLGLSGTVAYISYDQEYSTVAIVPQVQRQDRDEFSILAAAAGAYSSRQPHSHSEFNQKPSRGKPAVATQVVPSVSLASSSTVSDISVTTTPKTVTTSVVTPVVTVPPVPTLVVASPTPVVAPTQILLNPLTGKFGISVGATLSWLSDKDLNQELDDMVALGVGWVRYDFEWDQIQAGGISSYNWAVTDRVVNAVRSRNINLLPILAYAPAWARPVGCTTYMCGPANPADYAAFAKAAVIRYAPQGVHTWEIWNEPNIKQFWQPQPDAVKYASFLKAAYTAIKAQDGTALVISGGLAPAITSKGNISPTDFLTQLYQDGSGPFFDAFGFHPYSYPALPSYGASWNAWGQMSTTTTNLRNIMAMNGDSQKQIWMTEYGAPTGGPKAGATLSNFNFVNSPDHVDETLQVSMLTEALTLWKQETPWAGPIFWYSYKDLGVTPTTNENFFGLLRNDGSHKPAYDVLKNLLTKTQP